MLILTIHKKKENINKTWDIINFNSECDIVDKIEGETNLECSSIAFDKGYGNSELYFWSHAEEE